MPRSDYKHWKNDQTKNQVMFVTATALDFAHVFQRPEVRTEACKLLASNACHYGAKLFAYVVMTHHMHAVIQAPADKNLSWFMQRFKSHSAKAIMPLLTGSERRQLSDQSGLNGSRMWMRSFRGIAIDSRDKLDQKIGYIEANPVRSGLVEKPTDYPWCSTRIHTRESWSDADGFASKCLEELQSEQFNALVERYANLG